MPGSPNPHDVFTAKTVKRPQQQPALPQYTNYWAPLTRKRHIPPHPAQPRHTNYWAPRTRKRHQQEHRPQRPTERSDPTQHAKGRAGDCPGPRKQTATRRNVTRGVAQGRGGGDKHTSILFPAGAAAKAMFRVPLCIQERGRAAGGWAGVIKLTQSCGSIETARDTTGHVEV